MSSIRVQQAYPVNDGIPGPANIKTCYNKKKQGKSQGFHGVKKIRPMRCLKSVIVPGAAVEAVALQIEDTRSSAVLLKGPFLMEFSFSRRVSPAAVSIFGRKWHAGRLYPGLKLHGSKLPGNLRSVREKTFGFAGIRRYKAWGRLRGKLRRMRR